MNSYSNTVKLLKKELQATFSTYKFNVKCVNSNVGIIKVKYQGDLIPDSDIKAITDKYRLPYRSNFTDRDSYIRHIAETSSAEFCRAAIIEINRTSISR